MDVMIKLKNNMINKRKEISYYLFFILMILAKGIGLDSGDRLYYVLSLAACLCIGCKLVLSKYNIKQLAAMILLGVIAFAAYRNSGRLGILLSVLTIIGLKDIDIKKLFRIGGIVYGAAFAATVVLARLGVIANPLAVHEKGGLELIRWGMGYSTGNIFHVSYFMLTVFICYNLGKHYNLKWLLGLFAGNLLVFLYSLSYTGAVVTTFYLLLNLYAVKRRHFSTAEKLICQLPLPLCLAFSIGTPFLLEHPLIQRLDEMMQARLTFSAYYLQNQPVTLLGTRMQDVPYFWIIMDNGYVYILMTFGVITAALFAAGYAILIKRYSGLGGHRNERLPELAIIFSFLLYGIMEQFISNAFMNLSLLFMGEVLFGEQVQSQTQVSQEQEARGAFGMLTVLLGLAVFAGWLAVVPVKQCVVVPLTALNCVDAQSVQIRTVVQDGTKETLKEEMERYNQLLNQEQILDAAIERVGVTDRLSREELSAALECSLPVYIQTAEQKDVFRVRILELYWDITKEEYKELLESMVKAVQAAQADRYTVQGESYEEQIGKSFGTDRIEHISDKTRYQVEKTGAIVQLEHVRDAAAAAVLVMAAAAVGCLSVRYFRKSRLNG